MVRSPKGDSTSMRGPESWVTVRALSPGVHAQAVHFFPHKTKGGEILSFNQCVWLSTVNQNNSNWPLLKNFTKAAAANVSYSTLILIILASVWFATATTTRLSDVAALHRGHNFSTNWVKRQLMHDLIHHLVDTSFSLSLHIRRGGREKPKGREGQRHCRRMRD